MSLRAFSLLTSLLGPARAADDTGWVDDTSGAEAGCDLDGDGYDALACGGEDCHDLDAAVHPGAEDAPDDQIDQDCDGLDGAVDQAWVSGGAGTCASAPGPGPGALLLLLPLLAARRRR